MGDRRPHLLDHPGSCPAEIASPPPNLPPSHPLTSPHHTPWPTLTTPLMCPLVMSPRPLQTHFQHQWWPRTHSWQLNCSTGLSYHCMKEIQVMSIFWTQNTWARQLCMSVHSQMWCSVCKRSNSRRGTKVRLTSFGAQRYLNSPWQWHLKPHLTVQDKDAI